MQTLARLFSSSPFAPLQAHMETVASCVLQLPSLFNALKEGNFDLVETIGKEISSLEHKADCEKNDIRNHLPSSLFLPISRAGLLEILSLQDSIADKAEDTAVLLSLRRLSFNDLFEKVFFNFLNKNLEAFDQVATIIKNLHSLLESSFGGSLADSVRKQIHCVATIEHEADVLQSILLKKLFSDESSLLMVEKDFSLWLKVVRSLSSISNDSEKLANRISMLLE